MIYTKKTRPQSHNKVFAKRNDTTRRDEKGRISGFACPVCKNGTMVIDSRAHHWRDGVKRVRRCLNPECKTQFTTYEDVPRLIDITVTKRDGNREKWNQEKLELSIARACFRRPITTERMERIAQGIFELLDAGKSIKHRPKVGEYVPVTSKTIGELVLNSLRELDHVSYVKYAMKFRQPKDLADIQAIIDEVWPQEADQT